MKALCFGEILWDVDGETRTLGGAPLNVAGHIRRLGGESAVVSAVGDDELGRMTLEAIDRLGVDRSLVRISEYGTGVAEVTLGATLTRQLWLALLQHNSAVISFS